MFVSAGFIFLLGILSLFIYYYDERSRLHQSRLSESLFWGMFYAWMALGVLECFDSLVATVAWVGELTGTWFIILMAGLFGFVQKNRTEKLRMHSTIQELRATNRKPYTERTDGLVAVSRIAAIMARPWYKRTVRAKNEILDSLEGCTDDEDLLFTLNSWEVDLPSLFALGIPTVFSFLKENALRFDVVTKAKVIDALQRQGDFIFSRSMQDVVVTVLLATRGSYLTELKTLIDEGGDVFNLHKLVFRDLEADLSKTLQDHIRQESALEQLNMPCKMLSDIDDTLYCSGGHFPAGADKRFRKRVVYPGVLALFREIDRKHQSALTEGSFKLSRGKSDESASPTTDGDNFSVWLKTSPTQWQNETMSSSSTIYELRNRVQAVQSTHNDDLAVELNDAVVSFTSQPPPRVMSNIAFLSARPHAYKEYTETKSYNLFQQLRIQRKLHCMPTLLAGNMASSGRAALSGMAVKFRIEIGVIVPIILLSSFVYSSWHIIGVVLLFSVVLAFGVHQTLGQQLTSVWEPVGRTKADTFLEFERLYPECSTVFFGDNGQGDLLCAELLARGKANDGAARSGTAAYKGAFIHEVIEKDDQLSMESFKDQWEQHRICFYRTYVGAAVKAYEWELISGAGLARVGKAAVAELARLWMAGSVNPSHLGRFVDDMNNDISKANKHLSEELHIKEVPQSFKSIRHDGRRGIGEKTVSQLRKNSSFSDLCLVAPDEWW